MHSPCHSPCPRRTHRLGGHQRPCQGGMLVGCHPSGGRWACWGCDAQGQAAQLAWQGETVSLTWKMRGPWWWRQCLCPSLVWMQCLCPPLALPRVHLASHPGPPPHEMSGEWDERLDALPSPPWGASGPSHQGMPSRERGCWRLRHVLRVCRRALPPCLALGQQRQQLPLLLPLVALRQVLGGGRSECRPLQWHGRHACQA